MQAPDLTPIEFVPDTGAGVSLIKRKYLEHYRRVNIIQLDQDQHMKIDGVGSAAIFAEQAIDNFPLTLQAVDGEKIRLYGLVYVVDKLPVPCIIGNNILRPNGVNIMYDDVPGNYAALRIRGHYVRLHCTPEPKRKRVLIKAATNVIVPAGTGAHVAIQKTNLPRTAFGYLLTPSPVCESSNDTLASTGNQFLNGDETHITVANLGKTSVKIYPGQQLGYLEMADAPNRSADIYLSLDYLFEGLPPTREENEPDDPPAGTPFTVTPLDDDIQVGKADVSSEWGPDYEKCVRHVIQKHANLFRKELGRFNDDIKMPIPFYDGYDLSKLKQAPYSQSLRDERAIDEVLNPLRDQGRIVPVPLGKPSPVAAPAFVVWKNKKPRVVVDMRKVNKALIPDAYPLPKQDTILSSMGGAMVFSSLDFVKSFFQQDIAEEDQWKTAFVTAHRGHEMFTVSTMGLANSPGFFQHRMEKLFESYLWEFVLVYIDDIIIFSRSLEDHLTHLDHALSLLENAGVTLSISKCHFAYPSIQALGHHVSRLGLSTVKEKTEAIRAMVFPETLMQLEYALGFFGYYRQFVPHYSHIAKPLIQLKTRGFKDEPSKRGYGRKRYAMTKTTAEFADEKQRAECEAAFEELKTALCNAPTRAHPDFNRPFIFYVDGSQEKGFGCAVHQMDLSDPEKPIERPILYMSKTLSPTESRYWPTELETAALVWALQKLPQYTDHEKFVVYTDHTAIVNSFKDEGPVVGKRSERLQQWRLFLARFQGRMEIRHVPGREHLNADGLSRLRTDSDEAANNTSHNNQTTTATPTPSILLLTRDGQRPCPKPPTARRDVQCQRSFAFPLDASYKADLIQIDDEFRKRVIKELPTDPTLKKVYNEIRSSIEENTANAEYPTTTRETFRLDIDTGLLFQMAPDGQERLCIPAALHREVLRTAHDQVGHPGRTRTCERIRTTLYIPHLRKLAAAYISSCPVCRAARPSTSKPAGKLQPIDTPFIPFFTIAMDFIVGLPVTPDGFDAILTVTDKATKAVKLIPGKVEGDALYWAIRFWDYVVSDWGLPKAIISDRDGRFLSSFWRALFEKVGTTLAMTTAYHPQADGQSEKTNQTVEILLRCMIANHDAPMIGWDELLPDVQFAINTSRNFTTGETPFKLLYGVSPRDGTNVSQAPNEQNESAEQFYRDRQDIRKEAEEALKLAQAKMAIYYDQKHSPIQIEDMAYLNLTRKLNHGYRIPYASKLDVIRTGPFKVLERVGKNAFRLELPTHMKIHPVISAVHLSPAQPDPYQRPPVAVGQITEAATDETEETAQHNDNTSTSHPPPLPSAPGEPQRYIIDRILTKELRRKPGTRYKQWQYKVRWQGYDASEDSFVPEAQLRQDVPEIVDAWEQRNGIARRSRSKAKTT